MSESGGIFTFPMTGVYKVEWQGYFEETGNDTNSFAIYVTTDNGTLTLQFSCHFCCLYCRCGYI